MACIVHGVAKSDTTERLSLFGFCYQRVVRCVTTGAHRGLCDSGPGRRGLGYPMQTDWWWGVTFVRPFGSLAFMEDAHEGSENPLVAGAAPPGFGTHGSPSLFL